MKGAGEPRWTLVTKTAILTADSLAGIAVHYAAHATWRALNMTWALVPAVLEKLQRR